jgi:DNA-binding PadR family transcriptional regulator
VAEKFIAPDVFLPLRPLELLVLAMLGDGPLHGYGIRQAILEQTRGSIAVEAGNLYRHIRRLYAENLIELASDSSGEDKDERRRNFRLTTLGKRVLAAELERLRGLVQFAEQRRLIGRARA